MTSQCQIRWAPFKSCRTDKTIQITFFYLEICKWKGKRRLWIRQRRGPRPEHCRWSSCYHGRSPGYDCTLRWFNPLDTRNSSTATWLCCEATKYESNEPIPSFLGGQEPLLGSNWSLRRISAKLLNFSLLSLILCLIKLNHHEPEKWNDLFSWCSTVDRGQVGHKPSISLKRCWNGSSSASLQPYEGLISRTECIQQKRGKQLLWKLINCGKWKVTLYLMIVMLE